MLDCFNVPRCGSTPIRVNPKPPLCVLIECCGFTRFVESGCGFDVAHRTEELGHMATTRTCMYLCVGLDKIFVYFETVVHESPILSFPPPTCIAYPGTIPLHAHWTVYNSPSHLPCVCYTPYNVDNNNIVSRPICATQREYGLWCLSLFLSG